jgi:hypothetical protein
MNKIRRITSLCVRIRNEGSLVLDTTTLLFAALSFMHKSSLAEAPIPRVCLRCPFYLAWWISFFDGEQDRLQHVTRTVLRAIALAGRMQH